MKLKDFDNIRRAEILIPVVLNMVAKSGGSISSLGPEELMIISNNLSFLYGIDAITSGYTARMTSDYKELKSSYDEVINNTSNLVKEFELENPIEVFAFYIYLYRNGYLSHDNNFIYDPRLKDFPNMQGLDIVRGKGVCRSISSMLVDIYDNLGYDATNLVVYSTTEACKNQQKLCDTELHKTEISKKFVEFVVTFTNITKLGNHQITGVVDNNRTYILDPTNDGMLRYNPNDKKLYVKDSENYMKIKRMQQMASLIIGQGKYDEVYDRIENDITEEEYKDIYMKTLKLCKENISRFKEFYNENMSLYNDIYNLSEEQRGLFGRMFPFIPQIKKQKLEDEKVLKKI